ncbi:MAG TPA: sensor histidine kinase [Acetivibrio sp.]|nr:sensor histidine kinase [Acetivibrio sp.]
MTKRCNKPVSTFIGFIFHIVNTHWKVNLSFIIIIIMSVSILGHVSFRMISEAVVSHARQESEMLISQITKNVEVILTGLDSVVKDILNEKNFKELVRDYDNLTDFHQRAESERIIEGILKNRARTRTDIADIAVVTKKGEYITSSDVKKSSGDNALSYYAIKMFKYKNKDSMWLDTYSSEVTSTTTYTDNLLVVSNIRNIKLEDNKDAGILILNIRESYLYGIVSEIVLPDKGQLFIIGRDGNYVMNTQDRNRNGKVDYFKYDLYLKEILEQGNGSFIKKIDGKEYIIVCKTIDEINGTDLGWTVFAMTPIDLVTKGIRDASNNLLNIGIICIALALLLSIVIISIYSYESEKKFNKKHAILMERERLASLGELIGGIAYNFRTPISSIEQGLEDLKKLMDEYDRAIDNRSAEEEHFAIAAKMKEHVEKIKPFCSYISNVISTVKGQAVKLNDSTNESFTVGELLRRVKILMDHEFKHNNCELNVELNVSEEASVKGEINNLVQVLNNLIYNAIESYDGGGGKVDLLFNKKDKDLEIVVRDYGSGIPEDVKNKLFKQMITTKGKEGTGIGVYMSYSTIVGRFRGTMSIDSKEGEGTSVYVNIPL